MKITSLKVNAIFWLLRYRYAWNLQKLYALSPTLSMIQTATAQIDFIWPKSYQLPVKTLTYSLKY